MVLHIPEFKLTSSLSGSLALLPHLLSCLFNSTCTQLYDVVPVSVTVQLHYVTLSSVCASVYYLFCHTEEWAGDTWLSSG